MWRITNVEGANPTRRLTRTIPSFHVGDTAGEICPFPQNYTSVPSSAQAVNPVGDLTSIRLREADRGGGRSTGQNREGR